MRFAALTRVANGVERPAYAALLPREAEAGARLAASGLILQGFLRSDVPGALMIVEAPSRDAAERGLRELPLLGQGFFAVELLVPLADAKQATPAPSPAPST